MILFVIESFALEEATAAGGVDPFPVFERLRRRSLVLERHRVPFPATTRSLVSLLCSSWGNTAASSITKYRPDFRGTSFMETIKRSGYRTGIFTPTILEYDNFARAGFMRWFDEVWDFPRLRGEARAPGGLARVVEEEAVLARLEQFATRVPEPFFAFVLAYWTHAPYTLPFEDLSALPPLERYCRSLAYERRMLGRLVDWLERTGLDERTILIVTGDHGEGFGRHLGNIGHSNYLFEETVRVPTLFYIPGRLEREVRDVRPTSHADLMPTVLDLLGVAGPATMQGQSLVSPGWQPRPMPLFTRSGRSFNGVLDGSLKYFGGGEEAFLFDLDADPLERHNLAAAEPARVAAYRSVADCWAAWQERFITGER